MGLILGGVLLVTGAASGMGRSVAIAFAAEGAESLLLGDLNEAGLAETKEIISKKSPEVKVVITKLDVTNEASVDAFVKLAALKFGRVDYAVNAAGIAEAPTRFAECEPSSFHKCVAVNTRGTFLLDRAEIQQMLRQEPLPGLKCRGSIINITSLAGHGGAFEFLPSYTGSKSAVEALTRSVALDYGPLGIRVNSIAPGFTLTPMMNAHVTEQTLKKVIDTTPLRRLGMPEDIANACLFMSSPYASVIHGQSLAVDGGFSLEHYS